MKIEHKYMKTEYKGWKCEKDWSNNFGFGEGTFVHYNSDVHIYGKEISLMDAFKIILGGKNG